MKTPLSRILSHAAFCLALFVTSGRAGEKNPPGNIPGDQVFVPYTSAAGSYSLKVPEGWARSEKGSDVDFIDKFDGVAAILFLWAPMGADNADQWKLISESFRW